MSQGCPMNLSTRTGCGLNHALLGRIVRGPDRRIEQPHAIVSIPARAGLDVDGALSATTGVHGSIIDFVC